MCSVFNCFCSVCSWVLLSFSFLLGNDAMVDMLGIAIGHLYYFLEDVYPLMMPSRKRILKTPKLIELLFAQNPTPNNQNDHPAVVFEPAALDDIPQDQNQQGEQLIQ